MLVPALAHAQSVSDQAAAEALFKQARDLMAAGDYAQACPKLVESERLDPSAGTMLNLASCYEKNGQLASAWVTFKGAATAAQKANEPERAKLARGRVAKLEPRLPTLTITVAAEADLPGLVVTRDDEKVGRAEWGTPIPIDPGAHAVEASAPGHKTWQTRARVDGPGAKTSVEVPRLATDSSPGSAPGRAGSVATPATSPTPPSASPPSSAAGSTQRVLGVIVAGVGVAGLAVGSVFGVIGEIAHVRRDPALLRHRVRRGRHHRLERRTQRRHRVHRRVRRGGGPDRGRCRSLSRRAAVLVGHGALRRPRLRRLAGRAHLSWRLVMKRSVWALVAGAGVCAGCATLLSIPNDTPSFCAQPANQGHAYCEDFDVGDPSTRWSFAEQN